MIRYSTTRLGQFPTSTAVYVDRGAKRKTETGLPRFSYPDRSPSKVMKRLSGIANHPNFIGTVLSFYFQRLKKSGRPDFPKFQEATILAVK